MAHLHFAEHHDFKSILSSLRDTYMCHKTSMAITWKISVIEDLDF